MERLIDKYLPADYHDTFCFEIQKACRTDNSQRTNQKNIQSLPGVAQFFNEGQEYSLVKPLGLETGKVLKTEDCIIEDTENEAIMRKDDKLTYCLCLHCQDRKRPDRYNNRGSIS